MRQDQYERLQSLEERLLDVFIEEADPNNWPGAGIKIANMDQTTRGDSFWARKTAASVGVLYTRVGAMIGATQVGGGVTPPVTPAADSDGDDHEANQLDEEVARAEREALRLMKDLQAGTTKKDRKVHGR